MSDYARKDVLPQSAIEPVIAEMRKLEQKWREESTQQWDDALAFRDASAQRAVAKARAQCADELTDRLSTLTRQEKDK